MKAGDGDKMVQVKMENVQKHPLDLFRFCPKCGTKSFAVNNFKSKKCGSCGFVYYFNSSAAVACFLKDKQGRYLIARRASEPAKGTLDLIGGFVDQYETAEEAAAREMREETGLEPVSVRYLFSLPNVYPFSGFEVHTLDMVFECEVPSFDGFAAHDDVSELLVMERQELEPEKFGLDSIKKAVAKYVKNLQ